MNLRHARALHAITRAIESKGLHCVYDPELSGWLILQKGDADDGQLWERALSAPLLRLTHEELQRDDAIEVALRRMLTLLEARPL